jgi:glycosyltransferase involved in cell wall biosynthesis
MNDSQSNDTIRVVRIIDRLNIGGPAKHVTWLAAGMDPRWFETCLIAGTVPEGEGDMSYFAHDAGVEPLVIKEMSRELSPRDAIVVFKLLRQLFRFKPQIIHTHKAKAGAVGRVAALLYKWLTPSALRLRPRVCRVIHTYHGHIFHSYYDETKTKVFLAIERALARFCTDQIITISEQQRREICETFKVGRPGQYSVIPLGIDFDETKSQKGRLRESINVEDDVPLIGIVGRLCEVKNHAMFLTAAARLKHEGLNARFVIIGDGHLREVLEKQSASLGVEEIVSFTGFRDDVASLYTDLDIVALTSLNEGTPLTLIEAMHCGVPVVATEVGGVVDLMGVRQKSDGQLTVWDHGLTAPSCHIQAFTDALRYLIERDHLRRVMGSRGRAFVKSRMSKDRLVADMENLYGELLGKKRFYSTQPVEPDLTSTKRSF